MKIGYARVSTFDQNLDMQRDALQREGCEQIYEDVGSGKDTQGRPELENCLKALREGDTLIVWALDRLGRNTVEMIQIVNGLGEKNIAFRTLKENFTFDTGPTGQLAFHIFAAFAQYERNLIVERTLAGLKTARERGRMGGRRHKLTPSQQSELLILYEAEIPIKELCQKYDISRATLHRYLKKLKEEKP